MPELVGFSHIDLTVTNCERSARWWREVLGFELLYRTEGSSFEVWSLRHRSGLVVSVMTHAQPLSGAFDERRVGLDHLSLQVADRDELEEWAQHLDAHGVENTGVIDADFGATLVFRDPDNIQLEMFVHPEPEQLEALLSASSPQG